MVQWFLLRDRKRPDKRPARGVLMETIIKIELPPQQYEELAAVARDRSMSVEELVYEAVEEWMREQSKLERARALMRELGQGLGEGPSPHDAARQHDRHLYSRDCR